MCVCVCMCVFVCVCVHECMYAHLNVCVGVCMQDLCVMLSFCGFVYVLHIVWLEILADC